MVELYNWQKEAIEKARINNFNILISAGTGSGKTLVAEEIIKILKQKTLIVVPTIALADQWKETLLQFLKPEQVGMYHGQLKLIRPVTIGVINSLIKETNWDKEFNLLILDEAHRYCQAEGEFVKLLLNNPNFNHIVGLTATIERQDGGHQILLDKINNCVYEYTIEDAFKGKLISPFTINVMGIDLPKTELERINKLDTDIKSLMDIFKGDMKKVLYALKKRNRQAGRTLALISQRKKLFNNSKAKVDKALKLIENNKDKKIIVFAEYIDTIDYLYQQLKKRGISSYVYYSGNTSSIFKLNKKEKQELLNTFKADTSGVLLTVKSLDEGLNVPTLDMGIVLGMNKVSRQAIQRMGRLIRKVDDKHANMYMFYFKGTSDYWTVYNFIKNFEKIAKVIWK